MGQSTGVELLEFPAYASALLWCAFALFAYWSILDYLGRRSDADQIGQWWILAGLLLLRVAASPRAACSSVTGCPVPASSRA